VSVTLQQLEFFRAVARKLSFSTAARDLYTSQPYVSNQIRKLEDHYGVPLFVRSHPRIALTEAGQALYERVSRILDDIEELEQVVQQFQGLRRGTITLAATESAGNHVLPEMISIFNQEYPEIIVRARVGNTEDVLEWLDLDEAEIGVTPQRPDSRHLVSEPFYREALVVICPVDMDVSDPLSLPELAALPKVVREDGSLTLTKMHELLDEHPSGTDFVAQLGGTTAVNEAVAAGLGVSLVPERSAKAWLDAGSVRKVSLSDVSPHHSFYLVYPQRRYVTPATQALITHLRRQAQL
jgi:DNA-binding transcriptional LysR family regulator